MNTSIITYTYPSNVKMSFVFFMFLEAISCLTRLASQIDLLISEGPEGVWNLMVIVNNKVMANCFLLLRLCLSIFANLFIVFVEQDFETKFQNDDD